MRGGQLDLYLGEHQLLLDVISDRHPLDTEVPAPADVVFVVLEVPA